MRALHVSDLYAFAGAVRGLPSDLWPRYAAEALQRADLADRYRKRLGRRHPEFGDGTLAGVFGSVDGVVSGREVAAASIVLFVARATRGRS